MIFILYFKIQDFSMLDEDSKDNRTKVKETLLEWVRKKITAYVVFSYCRLFFFKYKFRFSSSSELLR